MTDPDPTHAATPTDDGGLTLRGEIRLDADEVALIRQLRPEMSDRHILATAVHAFLVEPNAESLREALDSDERTWKECVDIDDGGIEVGGTAVPEPPLRD